MPDNWFNHQLIKIDIEIEQFKKDLYNCWESGLFSILIKKFKQKESLFERELLCMQFMLRYKKYDIEKQYQIKKEIGLKD